MDQIITVIIMVRDTYKASSRTPSAFAADRFPLELRGRFFDRREELDYPEADLSSCLRFGM